MTSCFRIPVFNLGELFGKPAPRHSCWATKRNWDRYGFQIIGFIFLSFIFLSVSQ